METELRIRLTTEELVKLIEKRYKVILESVSENLYAVNGMPLAVVKIHGAVKRAMKAMV